MFEHINYYLGWTIHEALNAPVYWIALLSLLFLVCLLCFLRKSKRILLPVIKDDEGTIQITHRALKELVRKACIGIEGIGSPATLVSHTNNGVSLQIRLNLSLNFNIKKIREDLHREVRRLMVENLNFESLNDIDIIIVGFSDKD